MPYIIPPARAVLDFPAAGPEQCASGPVLVVAEDHPKLQCVVVPLCAALGIEVRSATDELGLRRLLSSWDTIAILTSVEGVSQDGYNVMMRVAEYERSLPVLLLTGREPALLGAAEAVQEMWQLDSVTMLPELPEIGELAEFLCNAVRLGEERRHTATRVRRGGSRKTDRRLVEVAA